MEKEVHYQQKPQNFTEYMGNQGIRENKGDKNQNEGQIYFHQQQVINQAENKTVKHTLSQRSFIHTKGTSYLEERELNNEREQRDITHKIRSQHSLTPRLSKFHGTIQNDQISHDSFAMEDEIQPNQDEELSYQDSYLFSNKPQSLAFKQDSKKDQQSDTVSQDWGQISQVRAQQLLKQKREFYNVISEDFYEQDGNMMKGNEEIQTEQSFENQCCIEQPSVSQYPSAIIPPHSLEFNDEKVYPEEKYARDRKLIQSFNNIKNQYLSTGSQAIIPKIKERSITYNGTFDSKSKETSNASIHLSKERRVAQDKENESEKVREISIEQTKQKKESQISQAKLKQPNSKTLSYLNILKKHLKADQMKSNKVITVNQLNGITSNAISKSKIPTIKQQAFFSANKAINYQNNNEAQVCHAQNAATPSKPSPLLKNNNNSNVNSGAKHYLNKNANPTSRLSNIYKTKLRPNTSNVQNHNLDATAPNPDSHIALLNIHNNLSYSENDENKLILEKPKAKPPIPHFNQNNKTGPFQTQTRFNKTPISTLQKAIKTARKREDDPLHIQPLPAPKLNQTPQLNVSAKKNLAQSFLQDPPVPVGTIFDDINVNNFKFEAEIGKGSYASVKLAIERHTQIRYALKIYPRFVLLDPHKLRNVKREITILRKLQHPNIIKMPFAFEDKSNQIIVGMEYVGKASLHSFLKQKPDRHVEEAEAKKLFSQLVEGINYCHSMNVVHRDIKLENILLDSTNNIKIIDFGFSIIIPEDKRLKIFCGTPSYMAPEIVSKIEYVGQKADIWALGILLYVMMQGKFPFKGVSDADLYKKIKKGTYTFTHPVSQSGEDIISQMLAIKPSDRPSASQILEHEWLRT